MAGKRGATLYTILGPIEPRELHVSFRCLALIFSLIVTAKAPVEAEEPLWLRYPAISPAGDSIAFSYQGDVYRVDAAGGQAVPLTLDDGYDFMPVWSRDGSRIAFASDRHGNLDVFVMPAVGGRAARLTALTLRQSAVPGLEDWLEQVVQHRFRAGQVG